MKVRISEWDAIKWASQFDNETDINRKKQLLVDVWQNTLKIVRNGRYYTDEDVIIDSSKVCQNSLFIENRPNSEPIGMKVFETEVNVKNADCLDVARYMTNPVVMNMASYKHPGGGVINGSMAQEENIFRRTNLYQSLYQYVDYANQYGIEQNPRYKYPLLSYGMIYSPDVTVFRGSERNGYYLLSSPYKVSFISLPAMKRPMLTNNRMNDIDLSVTKEKIRRFFGLANEMGHTDMVLSAFGCGSYGNPPEQISQLFKEVIDEYYGYFREITFAIFDDHNSYREHNPDGNLKPFKNVFDGYGK